MNNFFIYINKSIEINNIEIDNCLLTNQGDRKIRQHICPCSR